MKIPPNLVAYFGILSLLGGILVIYVLRSPLLSIFNFFMRGFSTSAAQKRAVHQRRQQQDGQPIRVRQTDIVQNMTSQERVQYAQADELIRLGRFVDAAKILESIRFQRRAIDILESNGLIEEACAVLIRLRVPFRAAVLYERNKMPEKAAYFYAYAGNHEKAAQIYMDLSHRNFRFLSKAAELYEKVGNHQALFKVWSRQLEVEKLYKACIEKSDLTPLFELLRDPCLAKEFFEKLNDTEIHSLIEKMELNPLMVQAAANWCFYYPRENFTVAILKWVQADEDLLYRFWQILSSELHQHLTGILRLNAAAIGSEIAAKNAECLKRLGKLAEAYDILISAGRFRSACEVLFEMGALDNIANILETLNLSELKQELERIKNSRKLVDWNSDQINAMKDLMKKVPNSDQTLKTIDGREAPKVIKLSLDAA